LNIFSRLYGKIVKYFLEQEFNQIEAEEQADLGLVNPQLTMYLV
jgi:hypothetical protein